ncbi:MAG: ribonuclease III [Rhizomicrobium sp.]
MSSPLETSLGHAFRDPALLERALTHASASASASNERLEFLGDRVLGLVIAKKLHDLFPAAPEGALALKFNALARREACAAAADEAGLADHVILAASEAASGGRRKSAILAGVCEAVIAALYIDGGFEVARAFIERYWSSAFASLSEDMRDAKTMLQEWAQGRPRGPRDAPVYRLVGREGPDHAPRFAVEVSLAGQGAEIGEGSSKREAEQAAARTMLARLAPQP